MNPSPHPLLARARAAWPDLVVDDAGFLAYVAATATGADEDFAELDVPVLMLGYACTAGDPRALATFETEYLAQVPRLVARITRDASLYDELKQRLRIKLFVAEAGAAPVISRYRRGSLVAWLRVIACRLAIDLLRERDLPMAALDETALERAALTEDPALAHLKAAYHGHVSEAFAAALAALTAADRTMLRLRFIDDLGMDEIGRVYQLSKSAVSRRLGRCRAQLLAIVRQRLRDQLGSDDAELETIMQLVTSQLHLSLSRLLRSPRTG